MSRFLMLRRGLPTLLQYDTRFGTATDTATGWITFGLKSGCRRIWLDSGALGNDANDGLSAATPKATLSSASALFRGTGQTPGDQLMIAGTGGRSYADNGAFDSVASKSGFSLTYPNAVLSYDPASPSDSTKYGRLLGADRPRIVFPTSFDATGRSAFAVVTTGVNYFAVQGLEFIRTGTGIDEILNGNGASDVHVGIAYQNCMFNQSRLLFDMSETAVTSNWSSIIHVSKCSAYGQWKNNGNCNWMYFSGTDGAWVQDCATVHNGWNLARTRADTDLTTGAAYWLGHGIYFGAENSNGRMDRLIGIDAAQDPFSLRGAHSASCLISLDNPVPGSFGGFSTSVSEAPNGVLITWDDFVFMGGDDIQTTAIPRGYGPGADNSISGSHLQNGVMFDNPKYGTVNSYAFTSGQSLTGQVAQYQLVNNVRWYNYSPTFEANSSGSGQAANVNTTYTNCIGDSLTPTMVNTVLTSCSTYSSAPSGYQTRDQVITTILGQMGITPGASYAARKAQLVNYLIEYPHLAGQVAMAIDTVGLQSFGLSPTTHPATTAPSFSGLTSPRSVY
jgi:hypothetical protein